MMPATNGKVRYYNLTTQGGSSGLLFTCEADSANPPLEAMKPIPKVVVRSGSILQVFALADEAVILRMSALAEGGQVFQTTAISASVTRPHAVWAATGSGCQSPELVCPVGGARDYDVPVEVMIAAVATGPAPEIPGGGVIPAPETRKGDCPVVIVYTPRLGD